MGLFSFLFGCKPKQPATNVQAIDPRKILFSLPTLCDPIPSVQPGPPPINYKALHEDDWRQIEFVPAANRENIATRLQELTAFKRQHRSGVGFTQVFIRPEHPKPFQTLAFSSARLPRLAESPLALGGGAIPGGFALSDSSDWFIYGQRSSDGKILHLGIAPGRGVLSKHFIDAIVDLGRDDLLLVDWYATAMVDTSSSEAIATWAQRYQ
jgi:hypothetical protein